MLGACDRPELDHSGALEPWPLEACEGAREAGLAVLADDSAYPRLGASIILGPLPALLSLAVLLPASE